jgi:hypothetical protein
LQKEIRDRLNGEYEIEYWPSSRFCRNKPSETYMREFNARLAKGALLVDGSGTGNSIARLVAKSEYPKTPALLLTKYSPEYVPDTDRPDTSNIKGLIHISDHIIELASVPNEGIYTDWNVTNDLGFDWDCEEIRVAHRAFEVARAVLAEYSLPERVNSEQLSQLFLRVRPAMGDTINFFIPALVAENKLRIQQGAGL